MIIISGAESEAVKTVLLPKVAEVSEKMQVRLARDAVCCSAYGCQQVVYNGWR